jgi:FkbM family methyltransferase
MRKLYFIVTEFIGDKFNIFICGLGRMFRQNFMEYFNNNDIDKAIQKLNFNLDEKSKEEVLLFISRIKKCFNRVAFIPIFFKKTQKEINDSIGINKIKKLIKKIEGNCISYKNYIVPNNYGFPYDIFYFNHGLNELREGWCGRGDIIDVGAFVGDSALMFSQYTDRKIYSFEPNPNYFDILLKTINLNGLQDNVIPVQKGLGDENIKMRIDDMSFIESISDNGKPNKFDMAEIITLDSFILQNNIKVGLIKTDLEGFEPKFLKGAIETIKQQRPILLISIYHNAYDFFEIKPLIESWNLNYSFKIRKLSNIWWYGDLILICEPIEKAD